MFSRTQYCCVTDRQTEKRTDRQTSCDGIVRAMRSIARKKTALEVLYC